jgi:hypothetical protein
MRLLNAKCRQHPANRNGLTSAVSQESRVVSLEWHRSHKVIHIYLHGNSESSASTAYGADNVYPSGFVAASIMKNLKLAMESAFPRFCLALNSGAAGTFPPIVPGER